MSEIWYNGLVDANGEMPCFGLQYTGSTSPPFASTTTWQGLVEFRFKESLMFIYLLQSGDTDYYKIGIAGNINARIKELQTGNPLPLKCIASANTKRDVLASGAAWFGEFVLHRVFAPSRMSGEWFRLDEKQLETIRKFFDILETGSREDIDYIENEWKREGIYVCKPIKRQN